MRNTPPVKTLSQYAHCNLSMLFQSSSVSFEIVLVYIQHFFLLAFYFNNNLDDSWDKSTFIYSLVASRASLSIGHVVRMNLHQVFPMTSLTLFPELWLLSSLKFLCFRCLKRRYFTFTFFYVFYFMKNKKRKKTRFFQKVAEP